MDCSVDKLCELIDRTELFPGGGQGRSFDCRNIATCTSYLTHFLSAYLRICPRHVDRAVFKPANHGM